MSDWYVYTLDSFPRTAAGPFPSKEQASARAASLFGEQEWSVVREEVCREIEQVSAEVRPYQARRMKVRGG